MSGCDASATCPQIDNGFGAAMLAARMLRTAAKIQAKIDSSHRVEALAGQPGRLS